MLSLVSVEVIRDRCVVIAVQYIFRLLQYTLCNIIFRILQYTTA
jgi:hypothetical protein